MQAQTIPQCTCLTSLDDTLRFTTVSLCKSNCKDGWAVSFFFFSFHLIPSACHSDDQHNPSYFDAFLPLFQLSVKHTNFVKSFFQLMLAFPVGLIKINLFLRHKVQLFTLLNNRFVISFFLACSRLHSIIILFNFSTTIMKLYPSYTEIYKHY